MFLHGSTRYLCPCGDSRTDPETRLPRALSSKSLHGLADLLFCPTCTAIRCSGCSTVHIESKYCPNCMTDYTDHAGITRCAKNCFECPKCDSPLSVTVQNGAADGVPGKQFTFKCVHCSYSYETRLVTKPAALSTIVRDEDPSIFFRLMEKYTLQHKLHTLQESSRKRTPNARLTPALIARMKAMDIRHVDLATLDEMDKLEHRLGEMRPREADLSSALMEQPSLPSGKHLAAKRKHTCGECSTTLLLPVADPRLMKYLKKEYALDIVPMVGARTKRPAQQFAAGSDTACLLSIVNPLAGSINVTISIVASVPATWAGVPVSVSLPITQVTIPGKRERLNTVDSIPSAYLTNNTAAARAEQLVRAVRREAQRKQVGPDEPFAEQGSHWATVPFSVSITGEAAPLTRPQIPFYITVEARRPELWGPGHGLKFGFWAVCTLE